MTNAAVTEEFDDIADQLVAAVHADDQAELERIVGGPWDGATQPVAMWAVAMVALLRNVAQLVPHVPGLDDHVEIQRCIEGGFPLASLSDIGRRDVVRVLTDLGLSSAQIAARTGSYERMVTRIRRKYHIHATQFQRDGAA